MSDTPAVPLKHTPLHARHVAHGARMVPFGGWDMPVEYSGIVDEHLAVRTRAGLFDVSHMGRNRDCRADALAAVQRISSNDASKLKIGQIHYSGLMTPEGTFVDDLLVYRLCRRSLPPGRERVEHREDFAWIREQIAGIARRGRRELERAVCPVGHPGPRWRCTSCSR